MRGAGPGTGNGGDGCRNAGPEVAEREEDAVGHHLDAHGEADSGVVLPRPHRLSARVLTRPRQRHRPPLVHRLGRAAREERLKETVHVQSSSTLTTEF